MMVLSMLTAAQGGRQKQGIAAMCSAGGQGMATLLDIYPGDGAGNRQ